MMQALTNRLRERAEHVIATRPPDFVIGAEDPGGPYLMRWYVTPWRRWSRRWRILPNLYIHMFLRSDDDRALHDHPSFAFSWMLSGQYIEHTIAAGGIKRAHLIQAGTLRYMPPKHAHRVEILKGYALTLFMFGPSIRHWGFHCPDRGWVPWEEFTAEGRPGERGRGCD